MVLSSYLQEQSEVCPGGLQVSLTACPIRLLCLSTCSTGILESSSSHTRTSRICLMRTRTFLSIHRSLGNCQSHRLSSISTDLSSCNRATYKTSWHRHVTRAVGHLGAEAGWCVWPSRRVPQGGLVTTMAGRWAGRHCKHGPCVNFTSLLMPALSTSLFATPPALILPMSICSFLQDVHDHDPGKP